MTLPFDPTRDREERDDLERLLQAALPATLAGGGDDHVDAEQLAAWSDGGLGPAEQARVDAHLASCGSCQELTAAFAKASPAFDTRVDAPVATPARVLAWTPRRVLKWIGPLAAAAAAVTLWMVMPANRAPVSTAVGQQAANTSREPATPVAPPAAAASPPVADAGAVSVEPRQLEQARRADAGQKASRDISPPTSAMPTISPTPAPSVPAVVPPITPPAAAPVTAPPDLRPPPPAATPPAQSADASANRARMAAEAVEVVTIPTFEVVTRPASEAVAAERAAGGGGAGRGGAARGAQGQAGALRNLAVTAAEPPRWRVVGGRRIERSPDAGRTWLPLAVDPPSTIVAGASPVALVCWLVGEHGLVLITTDGERFARVSPPADVSLTLVVATTERDATVTTVDGRRFVTTDGGQTWRPLQ